MKIVIHDEQDLVGMRAACCLAAETLDFIAPHVLAGVSTDRLDGLCHDFIVGHGARPAPLNYRGFPKSICTSVNEVVCHGIPGARVLREGDILNIDVTVVLDGWHGDTSRMFAVGTVDKQAEKLIQAAHEAMMRGISAAKPGNYLGAIGHQIESYTHAQGYSVVREYCGHGIGRDFHAEPQVLNFGRPHEGPLLRPGMFFTIEPMINIGSGEVVQLEDNWTVVTKSGMLSAQFEHTISITEDGCEILTLPKSAKEG